MASSSVNVSSFPSTAFLRIGCARWAPKPVAIVEFWYVVPFKSTYPRNLFERGDQFHADPTHTRMPLWAPLTFLPCEHHQQLVHSTMGWTWIDGYTWLWTDTRRYAVCQECGHHPRNVDQSWYFAMATVNCAASILSLLTSANLHDIFKNMFEVLEIWDITWCTNNGMIAHWVQSFNVSKASERAIWCWKEDETQNGWAKNPVWGEHGDTFTYPNYQKPS